MCHIMHAFVWLCDYTFVELLMRLFIKALAPCCAETPLMTFVANTTTTTTTTTTNNNNNTDNNSNNDNDHNSIITIIIIIIIIIDVSMSVIIKLTINK